MIRIGTAGWALPKAVQDRFPGDGAHLARYAEVFSGCEINSSFHRSHRRSTYERWAASVPDGFQFSVKVPKTITHVQRLHDAQGPLDAFLEEIAPLRTCLGCLLVQLPPSLELGPQAEGFFASLRARHGGDVAVEPRHASWFSSEAAALLDGYRCARVAADPAPVAEGTQPGGWERLRYWRWHGSPRMYYSAYPAPRLDVLGDAARRADREGASVWCIFDNTASGAATSDALALLARVDALP